MDKSTSVIIITSIPQPSGGITVTVSGDLDVSTAPTFRDHMDTLVNDHRGGPLDLDLSAVDFCDLTGLRALYTVGRTAAQRQHRARITAAAASLDILLQLCWIPDLLGYTPPSEPTATA